MPVHVPVLDNQIVAADEERAQRLHLGEHVGLAMVAVEDEEPVIECANDLFRFIAEWDERMGENSLSQVPVLRSGPIGTRLATFLHSNDPAHQFETADGRSRLRRRPARRRNPCNMATAPSRSATTPSRSGWMTSTP